MPSKNLTQTTQVPKNSISKSKILRIIDPVKHTFKAPFQKRVSASTDVNTKVIIIEVTVKKRGGAVTKPA